MCINSARPPFGTAQNSSRIWKSFRRLALLCSLIHSIAAAQLLRTDAPHVRNIKTISKEVSTGRLTETQETEVPSEVVTFFIPPLRCDGDGNLYLHNDETGVTGIRKLSSKGKRLAMFQSVPEIDRLKAVDGTRFFVGANGELDQLVELSGEASHYILVYQSDGTLKSKVKLELGVPWVPATLASFPSGTFLVTGQVYDRDRAHAMWPVTGIFSSNGTLLKEIKLEDDKQIRDMSEAGDRRVTSAQNPTSSRAVAFSQMEAAGDGNVYLMRWLPSPIVYAISEGGEVAHKFRVDPGDPNYRVVAMHISGPRLALLFVQPQTREELVKIVDLKGHELAIYHADEVYVPGDRLGTAFACYNHDPEQFIFLSTGSENKLHIVLAEPRQ